MSVYTGRRTGNINHGGLEEFDRTLGGSLPGGHDLYWKESVCFPTAALGVLSSRALSSRWAGRVYHDPINGKK
jgi:hypothetical protein